MTIEIAVNRHFVNKLGKGDTRWAEFNDTFENVTLTQVELRQEIRNGHAFTSPHNHERHLLGKDKSGNDKYSAYRHSLNWYASQHLALDHDDLDFDAVLVHDFILQHGSFVYTTPRHTPLAPRTRTVFVFEKPITDKAQYAELATALVWKFSGVADSQCKDVARLFFGSKECEIRNIGQVLPVMVAEELCREFRAAMTAERQRRPTVPNY